MQPRIGYRVGCVLEGWNIDDNTDVPGEGLFYDTGYKCIVNCVVSQTI